MMNKEEFKRCFVSFLNRSRLKMDMEEMVKYFARVVVVRVILRSIHDNMLEYESNPTKPLSRAFGNAACWYAGLMVAHALAQARNPRLVVFEVISWLFGYWAIFIAVAAIIIN